MPRKSPAASLATVDTRLTRLEPGDELTEDAARIFRATVAAAAPDHFREVDRVALNEFAAAAARCQRAEAAISEEGDIVGAKPNPWLLVLRDARHQVATLLPKLRLCPSARLQPKQIRPTPARPVPWECQ